MTVLTVVQDVCEVVGVEAPTSIFANIGSNRTMQEMLRLADEMAQRIAGDTREWSAMKAVAIFSGAGESYAPPADFKRMLVTTELWRSTQTMYPMRYIPDLNEWINRRSRNYNDSRGEWINYASRVHFSPMLYADETVTFPYLTKNCINLTSGGVGDHFMADSDTYLLDERLLKLGMIWQWKANKGSPYAEDMGTWSDALAMAFGTDKPAPTMIDRQVLSNAFTGSVSGPAGFSIALQGPTGPTGPAGPTGAQGLVGPQGIPGATGPTGPAGSGGGGGSGTPSDTLPLADGAPAAGALTTYSRGDHRHPTDTSLAPLASPALTGTPTAPTAAPATNTTQVASTAFVTAAVAAGGGGGGAPPATVPPLMDSVAAVGTTTKYAREDHVHPSDTAKANLASPVFTGNPTAPTPTVGDNDTSLATTAFVTAAVAAGGGGGAAPATVPPLMDGAAAVGTTTKYAREDHRHPTDTSLAPLASPGLTGVPTAPTASVGTNSTQLATTAFVSGAMSAAGAISEAPNDGQYYSRRNLGWSITPGGMTDAPVDGSLYGRFNATWSKAAPLASPALTGVPLAPTAAPSTNTTQLATTAFVTAAAAAIAVPIPATVAPLADGTATVGVATKYAREDHKHPTDTTLAPLASPTLTGTPAAPTATGGTNTTQIATTAFVTAAVAGVASVPPATVAPIMDGAAAVGVVAKYAREDHVHPSDTSRAAVASPTFTGVPAAPTATGGTNTTQLATTAFVAAAAAAIAVPAPATVAPLADGTATVGVATKYAREDHKHPTDTTLAPLASPTFTGTPAAPTAAPATSTTQVATTAFVGAAITAGAFAPLASPTFTGDPKAPTATTGDNDTSIATTAFVNTAVLAKMTYIGDTPPGTPIAGQLFWESDSGNLFIYYNDGNTSQWVPATVGIPGPPGIWTQITQAAYNALAPPNANVLYIVVG